MFKYFTDNRYEFKKFKNCVGKFYIFKYSADYSFLGTGNSKKRKIRIMLRLETKSELIIYFD